MTCEKVKKLLAAYSVGAFSPNRRIKIKAHLSQCPECQRELSALERVGELLNRIPLESTADARLCWNSIEAKISQLQRDSAIGWNMLNWFKFSPALSFVSVLLILLAVGTTLVVMTSLQPVLDLNTTATSQMLGMSVVEGHLYASWYEPFAQRGDIATEIEILNRGIEE